MESDKIMYWMTLGLLAMAAVSGVTEHRSWVDRLADCSIATMSRASEKAMNYAEMAGVALERGQGNSARPLRVVVEIPREIPSELPSDVQADLQNADFQRNVQNRLACVRRVLVRRQAELVRVQAMRVQMRMLERAPRAMLWPNSNIVIDIPELPQVQVGAF